LVALPEQGSGESGDLSQRLAGIYRYLLDRLGQANIFDDTEALDDCAAVVTTLRDSWIEGLRRP
ncbi:MAG: flagellar protein FliS, partial [Betaproteobacteria bacterium]|nr:flagellar protein FliS [Betaproteobacteria bacterium]